jgi:UDP-glucose 4-epimerase|tara:strand:- start:15376 stop:16308 length:933 start_codon:yes stop_codon:yes gene_type:complete
MDQAVSNKKILITGGTGYIGSYLGKYLSLNGLDVTLGTRNIPNNPPDKKLKYLITDWNGRLDFCKGFDTIIHCAGISAKECFSDPVKAFEFNSNTSKNFIERSIKNGCSSFFYISSIHIYGRPFDKKYDESTEPYPDLPYGASKLLGEYALLDELKKNTIKGSVLRLSNCFGPPILHTGDCWNLLLNNIIKNSFNSNIAKITGNPHSLKDFLPIKNFAEIILLLVSSKNLPNKIQIASGETLSILGASKIIKNLFLKKYNRIIDISYNEDNIENEDNFSFDVSVLKELGFKFNKLSLEKEIEATIEYLIS